MFYNGITDTKITNLELNNNKHENILLNKGQKCFFLFSFKKFLNCRSRFYKNYKKKLQTMLKNEETSRD